MNYSRNYGSVKVYSIGSVSRDGLTRKLISEVRLKNRSSKKINPIIQLQKKFQFFKKPLSSSFAAFTLHQLFRDGTSPGWGSKARACLSCWN